MMVDSKSARKWLHDIANRAMPLGGMITLMRLGKLQPDNEQLQELENKFEALSDAIGDARSELVARAANTDQDAEFEELTYLSKCTLDEGSEDFEHMLVDIRLSSAERNEKSGVTGYLLYFNGYFLQRLEGISDNLRKLMSNIVLDNRHKSISVLSHQPIEKSTYPRWQSMFSLSITENDDLNLTLNELVQCVQDNSDSQATEALLRAVDGQLQQRAEP